MPDELERRAIVDGEHLKLLSLGYKISAAVSAFFSLIGLLYMAMGIFMGELIAHAPPSSNRANQPPPAFVGWVFGGIGFVIFVAMIVMAALKFKAALCIERRKSKAFCMVIGALGCLEFPYGTLLGVFTFIVLGRDSVIAQFATPPSVSDPSVLEQRGDTA